MPYESKQMQKKNILFPSMFFILFALICISADAAGQNKDSLLNVLKVRADSAIKELFKMNDNFIGLSKKLYDDSISHSNKEKKNDGERDGFTAERKNFSAQLEKETTHSKLLQDSVNLVLLEKRQLIAELNHDSSISNSLKSQIVKAQGQLAKSSRLASLAKSTAHELSIQNEDLKKRNDLVIKNDSVTHVKMLALYKQDTLNLGIQNRKNRSIQSKLDENHADQIIYSTLMIMASCIAIYIFTFFFFRTKKILQRAKSIHKNEPEAILRDTLIRYHYYNKAIEFTQSLLYISIAMSVIYALVLFYILINTGNFGAGLKTLLDKDSLSTLGVLATPLIFSITLYNFTEVKIQDNARLISELRKP